MISLASRTLLFEARNILVPAQCSEVDELAGILDSIAPFVSPASSVTILGLCPTFAAGLEDARAYSFYAEHIQRSLRDALDEVVTSSGWSRRRMQACLREGGLPKVASAAHDVQADLILLATSMWMTPRWLPSKAAHLRRLTDRSILLLPKQQPPRDSGGWPARLSAMMRAAAPFQRPPLLGTLGSSLT